MDDIDSLIEEHAKLRRLAGEIEKALGSRRGIGWDDRAACALAQLREAQRTFHEELKRHEEREDRFIDSELRGRADERVEMEPEIQRAHATLDGMTALVRTLSDICDGTHVYAVRTVVERLLEELEAHMTYEEKVLFPLIRERHRVP